MLNYNCYKNTLLQVGSIDQRLYQIPVGLPHFSKHIFKLFGCEVYTTLRECDDVIANYVKRNNCFGILGQDTDFVIYETGALYCTIGKLNLRRMTAVVHDGDALARSLNLQVS